MTKIIEKPWGSEEIIEINEIYMFKKLLMKKGHRCSLQYHEHKKETIYVLSGELRILYGEDRDNLESKIYMKGESITIEPMMVHRMEAVSDSEYFEASTPEIDDVIRLSDDYERSK
ncbi:mannose-6-phosphate isomerase-like protein (cupin superfamily) [Clostridium saccharoperbutylacetonicum]|uniref:Mannose-6-phosphate isomerase n=1 Tax=Clostridium saccharoperbutylacetonicum N1-4(HMT) TaxID=931276 RepID=M1MK69_9CLOT|nr:cupin domain-containing protein [Clostridium saccharoperbutylacetonicum]AGF58299.1 mannose-6-phosphate isomerase [Clostridium saccharoperbutylacetonicum N1-4(HMT)]NRT60924.1 mannose-6-phosphate isomerase-like protein (cupin superfamily) [Clostridium saccharoperbutylacetonicum]NSB24237.1 mannose-6-phosphate isomerase-like protein (cupin superfamily) [Clostridium saccharoperbutylacetonicum]NSB43615.1 mannose-6-phosphate isomerase-like protein (cupin superfamily) [Clostridium saccharoperbutylac